MSRLELHEKFCEILGNNYVYFQPPATVRLNYPCILYTRSDIKVKYADSMSYHRTNAYTVTFIHRDPDSYIPNQLIEKLPYCSFDRNFNSDELIHDVFTVFD